MSTIVEFLTNSRYYGTYYLQLHEMEGFGLYTYPDLSEYRGYFRKGKFHGYGRIKLAPPYSSTFRCLFENGKISKIYEMMFKDGLKINISFDGTKLDTSKWAYCTAKDRRYAEEVLAGLTAVGIDWSLNQERHTREIKANTYDAEEGILLRNGFLTNIPPPFAKRRFLACTDEEEWIKQHCRTSIKRDPLDIDKATVNSIVNANIKAAKRKHIEGCPCGDMLKHDYLAQMCERECQLQHRDSDISDDQPPVPLTNSSISKDTFYVESLIDEMDEDYCRSELAQLEIKTSDYRDLHRDTEVIGRLTI